MNGCCFQLIIITHGYQPDQVFPRWVVDMAQAVNLTLEPSEDPQVITNSVVGLQGQPNVNGSQHFILFDWASVSGQPGIADNKVVAGDLYRLVHDRLQQELAAGRTPIDVHFIGHSRGVYVNNAVIGLLKKNHEGRFIRFLQVTMLDSQANGADGKLLANPGGIVDWTHNFYQLHRAPKGKPIPGALNIDLSDVVETWLGRPDDKVFGPRSHSEVHDWYHWMFDQRDLNGDNADYLDDSLDDQHAVLRLDQQNKLQTTRDLLYRTHVLVENFNDSVADGFSLNGVASVKDGELELTPSQLHCGGSAFFQVPIDGDFTVEFTFRMVDPNDFAPADGLTFAMLDAEQKELGKLGGELGYSGLSGLAVAFDTFYNWDFNDVPAPWNEVGLRVGGDPHWYRLRNATTPEPLSSGNPFRVRIAVAGKALSILLYSLGADRSVFIEAKQCPIPHRKLIGFTAATGAGSQRHLIDDVIVVLGKPK